MKRVALVALRNLAEILSGVYVIIGVDVYRRKLKCGLRDKISLMLSLDLFRLNPTSYC